MEPKTILRAEGITVFITATGIIFLQDGQLWLFLVLALTPDISMIGYLAGPRIGSITYNTDPTGFKDTHMS